jgi:hypothetical protein
MSYRIQVTKMCKKVDYALSFFRKFTIRCEDVGKGTSVLSALGVFRFFI